jgi:hypothetical protein
VTIENSNSKSLIEYLLEKDEPTMKRTIRVNHIRSGMFSLIYLSHIIEISFVLFLSNFLLGPAVFFIINGLFFSFLFTRPHWYRLLAIHKFLFRLTNDDYYMQEVHLGLGFWIGRILMAIIALGQIALGVYYLARYGFLDQNLIHLISHY